MMEFVVRNAQLVEEFEREYAQRERMTIEQKYAILNAMYEYARNAGAFPPKDPLDGIEVDIEVARVLARV